MRRMLLKLLIELTFCHLLWARFIIHQGYYDDDDDTMLDYQSNYHSQPTEYGYRYEYGYNPHYTPSHPVYQFSRSMPFIYKSPGSYYDQWRKVHRPLPGGGSCISVDYYKQCSEGFVGLKSHPTHQQYYYICKPDQIILGKCLHSQIFNHTMGRCVKQLNLVYEPTCTSYGIYPILYNCNLYYRCDRNLQYRLYNCPKDMIFSLTQRKCVHDDKCIPRQIVSNDTFVPESLEKKFPPCLKVGVHRSPDDCSLYFKCEIQSNGIYLQTRFKCPVQMFYDENTNQCLPQQISNCLQINGEPTNYNNQQSMESEKAPFSIEETEGSGNDEPSIITDKPTQTENSLSTAIDPELMVLPTVSDVEEITITTERLSTLIPPFANAIIASLSEHKLNASGNKYKNKMTVKMRDMAFLENLDMSTDINSDSNYMNNEIEVYTTELSNSKLSEFSEENLIAVTETSPHNQQIKEVLSHTNQINTMEESNTELCTKSTTELPTKETLIQIPHLEIIAKQPLDVHLSICTNDCSRTYKHRNDFKDNQTVLLRWFNNATSKTLVF